MIVALLVLLWLAAGLPLRGLLARLRWPLYSLLPFVVLFPLLAPGPRWGSTPLAKAGLLRAAVILLKGVNLVAAASLAFDSARFESSTRALRGLRVPARLVEILAVSYRFFFVLSAEVASLRLAWRSRGGRRPGFWRQARQAGAVVGTLLIKAVDKTERVVLAMRARGYRGALPCPPSPPASWAQVMAAALFCLGLAASFLLEVYVLPW